MSHHRYPICPASGKLRYGEPKDIKLAMRQADWDRSRARLNNIACSRREIRSYECPDCNGWHLTSKPDRPNRLLPMHRYSAHVTATAAQAIQRIVEATGRGTCAAA
jgi:hypothetical protein